MKKLLILGATVGFALLVWLTASWIDAGEAVWHLSESAPLLPIEPPLPDDGSWDLWRAATIRWTEAVGEEAFTRVDRLVKGDGAPDPDALAAALERVAAPTLALPDPKDSAGFRVALDRFDGAGEQQLPPRAFGPGAGLLALAWERAFAGDGAGAEDAVRRALRLGVLYEHSGGNLVAVMTGVHLQRRALDQAIAMAPSIPLHDLLADARAAVALPSGVAAGLLGDCAELEAHIEEVGRQARMAAPLFSTRRTLALHRWRCRQRVAAALAPAGERTDLEFPATYRPLDPRALVDNPVGRILLDIATVPPEVMASRRDRLAASVDQLARAVDASSAPGAP
jgi:hypothetical protein